mgnify:FL=1|jgi:TM2 domain-containing membrane protein YozV|nr:MAG TPA: TM2 domain [Caudoviricetes sp.]
MYCVNCGKELSNDAKFCPECGQQTGVQPQQQAQTVIIQMPRQPKSRAIAVVLCVFFGYLGLHKFYLGSNKTGFLFLTGGIIAIFVYLLNLPPLTLIPSLILGCALLVDLVLLLIKERI